jgi:hypothetical protein
MNTNLGLSARNDVRRIAVLQVGSILAFETPTGNVIYDMASDNETSENTFLKLFRREEKRLAKLDLSPSSGCAMRTKSRRLAIIAYSLVALTAGIEAIRPSYADDPQPPANVSRCDSIEQLEEAYPNSHFTKLSPDETTAFINKFPDPANKMVVFFAVPFPKDPRIMVIHGYTINGCWVGAMQLPVDAFEQIIRGGEI